VGLGVDLPLGAAILAIGGIGVCVQADSCPGSAGRNTAALSAPAARSVVATASPSRQDSNGLRNRDQWPGADWDTTPINAHIAIHHGARVDRLNSTKVTR